LCSFRDQPDEAVDCAASSSSHAATSPSQCIALHLSHSVTVCPSAFNQPQLDGVNYASVPHHVASITSHTHSAAASHAHSAATSYSHSAATSPTNSIAASPSLSPSDIVTSSFTYCTTNSPTNTSKPMDCSHSEQLLQLKCSELQEELANQKRQYDHDIMLLKEQHNDHIVAMESSKQQQMSVLKSQLSLLQNVLANERTRLASLVSDQINNVTSLRTQQSQVEEECQLVTLVSQSQSQQVAMREENITHLQAEVSICLSVCHVYVF